jgi:glycine cleavage system H protein
MNNVPADLKYTNGTIEIGITDHAQHALGDLVFVEVPEKGRVLKAGDACAVVESVKAASDVYCPIAGEVTASNPALAATPEIINEDAFGRGWLLRLRPAAGAAPVLLSPAEYEAVLAAEDS